MGGRCGRRLVSHLDNVGAEPVADAPHRRDVPGGVRIILKLAAQTVHDDPKRVPAVGRTPAPDLADDRLDRQGLVRPGHEEGQDGVLGWRERERRSVEHALPGEKIDGQPLGPQEADARRGGPVHPPEQGSQPGQDVVIAGARIDDGIDAGLHEGDDALRRGIAEHNQGRVRHRPDGVGDLARRHSRQSGSGRPSEWRRASAPDQRPRP